MPTDTKSIDLERLEAVAAMFEPWAQAGEPGLALVVQQGGRTVLARGWGLANVEFGVPITERTRFDIASMTKQFVAAVCLYLERDGKLSLDDPVARWLPDMAGTMPRDTLRDLLTMRTGLLECGHLSWLATGEARDARRTAKTIHASAARLGHRNFPPGTEDCYSNVNFHLAQLVAEAAGGADMAALLRRYILDPLGLELTEYVPGSPRTVVPHRATAYEPAGEGRWRHAVWVVENSGACGIVSCAQDMARWQRALLSDELAWLRRALCQDRPLPDGLSSHYRLGMRVGQHRGLWFFGHAGGVPGFKSNMLCFPEEELAFVFLANRDDVNSNFLASRIADQLLKPRIAAARASVGETRPPPADELERLLGLYLCPEADHAVEVTIDQGLLRAEDLHFEQRPDGSWTVIDHAQRCDLSFGEDARTLLVRHNNGPARLYQRVRAEERPALPLEAYAGRYAAEGLPGFQSVDVVDGHLRLSVGSPCHVDELWWLVPIGGDRFAISDTQGGVSDFILSFQRDAKGLVVATVMSGYRLYGLRLERRTEEPRSANVVGGAASPRPT
ncbi:MAG TPA: serine hydrolase [Azospirillaceae bacterium]|nr:serine hydrolase [Azospirillaceae bacterium]